MSRKYIIDTDAGEDDAVALMLALSSPALEIIAITTVSGNTIEPNVYRNVKEVVRVCQKQTPIYRGASRPLINLPNPSPEYHGEDGLKGYWDTHTDLYFPPENPEKAANAIIRLAHENPGLGIICLGPLTNLALAYCLDASLTFGSVEIMGGTIDGVGNVTVLAEYNVYCDPEAAHIVFDRSQNMTITPWETTARPELMISDKLRNELVGGGGKSRFFAEIYPTGNYVCDALAVAVAIDPSIVTALDEFPVEVELSGKYSRGHTIVMRDDMSKADAKLRKFKIVRNMDSARFEDMLLEYIRN